MGQGERDGEPTREERQGGEPNISRLKSMRIDSAHTAATTPTITQKIRVRTSSNASNDIAMSMTAHATVAADTCLLLRREVERSPRTTT